ncbi:MAG: hypothetical protein AAF004_11730 [Pseudomonadota bacterium]
MKRVGLVAAALALSACGSPGLKTADISYYSKQSPVPAIDGCIFVLDARLRTEAHGWSLPKPEMRGWLVDGIAARSGARTVYVSDPPALAPFMTLDRVYIKHIATSMAGVAVLTAHTAGEAQTVRGNMTRLNWSGNNNEFSRILSQALNKAIARAPIADLLRSDCEDSSKMTQTAGASNALPR